MAMRHVNETIILSRKGEDGKPKRVKPAIGKNFDFTKEEIEQITAKRPQALSKAFKEIEDDESEDTADTAPVTTAKAATSNKTATAPAGGGKKPAGKDEEL